MSQVQVISAVYGSTGGSMDVTNAVQQQVDAGNLTIAPSPTLFGQDPDPGVQKGFGVIYRVAQARYSAMCVDGQAVTIGATPPPTIVAAVFGSNAGSFDVTAAVQGLVNAGVTTITANIATFGDPSVGTVKAFTVSWMHSDGSTYNAGCAENGTVTIS